MNDQAFWQLIEQAWKAAGPQGNQRAQLTDGSIDEDDIWPLADILEGKTIPALREKLNQLSQQDLALFDNTLERKLYDIDRAEIHQYTDGSDDGFLYARGFIVGMGQAYYDTVNATPSLATSDVECEGICYLSYHVYRERFGDMPNTGICRESCSNAKYWE